MDLSRFLDEVISGPDPIKFRPLALVSEFDYLLSFFAIPVYSASLFASLSSKHVGFIETRLNSVSAIEFGPPSLHT